MTMLETKPTPTLESRIDRLKGISHKLWLKGWHVLDSGFIKENGCDHYITHCFKRWEEESPLYIIKISFHNDKPFVTIYEKCENFLARELE